MSTKIYDAFEFKGDLDELMAYLNQLRKRVWGKSIPLFTAEIDDGHKFGWLSYTDALKKAFRSHEHYIVEKGFGCIQNAACSAVVYTHKGRLFVQFFGLPRDLKLTSKKLVDYHYQNQSDTWYDFDRRAKNKVWYSTQAKNYRERRRTWEAIFKKSWRPNSAGMVFEFISVDDAMDISVAVFKRLHGHDVFGRKEGCSRCATETAHYEAEKAAKELELKEAYQ